MRNLSGTALATTVRQFLAATSTSSLPAAALAAAQGHVFGDNGGDNTNDDATPDGSSSSNEISIVNNNNSSSSNNNSSLGVAEIPLIKQPVYMVAILSLAYGMVLLLALLGNACVLAVVVRDKRFHSATYVFIANLAVADLLVALFCNPLTLLSNIFSGWWFGAFMCKATPYLQGVSVCASVNTLAAIAVDRYLAICHVLRIRMTMRIARFILTGVWLFALAIMIPWAVYYKQEIVRIQQQNIPVCYQEWPHERQQGQFFLGAIFLFCYALPLSFIICCYFLIGWRVWNRDAPGITTERGVIQKSKIRVVKMLAVVVLLFALSWLPLYVVYLIFFFFKPNDNSPEMEVLTNGVIPLAQWLGQSNSCMNPLVYCLFSKRIRERIRLMITCSARSEARRALSMYSSSRHMTVDYCNGQVKLAFRSSYHNHNHGRGFGLGTPRSCTSVTALKSKVALGLAATPSSNEDLSEENILTSETMT